MTNQRRDTTGAAREFARVMDSAFRVPGTRFRFGLDPVLGLVPGLGDAIGGGFGFYLLVQAFRAGVPPVVMIRMFANIAADLLFGAVPLLGDLFDAAFKANMRNLRLLERHQASPEATRARSFVLLLVLLVVLLLIIGGALWLLIAAVGALVDVVS